MEEVYRIIPGHEHYKVSDHGNVWSCRRNRLLKPLQHNQGYLQISLGAGHRCLIHSLVLEVFVGPRPDGAHINHKDGNKRNNCLSNLEYCTAKRNSEHAVRTGLTPMPPGAGRLTQELVLEIDRRTKAGETGKALASEYGISDVLVSCISNGKAWQWLTGNSRPPVKPKLSLEDREQIKALLAEGQTGRFLAECYGVSTTTISHIKNGERCYPWSNG